MYMRDSITYGKISKIFQKKCFILLKTSFIASLDMYYYLQKQFLNESEINDDHRYIINSKRWYDSPEDAKGVDRVR